jgi:carbamate kinase
MSSAVGAHPPGGLHQEPEPTSSDPAFGHPAKFIGTSYAQDEAQALAARLGWAVAADGPRWRRVVASPRPRELAEIDTVRALVDAGVLVVCGGGGGVPVVRWSGRAPASCPAWKPSSTRT